MIKKKCDYCGKYFEVRFNYEAKRRRFCNWECSNKGTAKQNSISKTGIKNPMWKHGLSAVKRKRGSIRKILPVQCERCGNYEQLVAHHKNRNQLDNRIENLEIICRSCHAKEHNFYKTIKNLERDKYGKKLPKGRNIQG